MWLIHMLTHGKYTLEILQAKNKIKVHVYHKINVTYFLKTLRIQVWKVSSVRLWILI